MKYLLIFILLLGCAPSEADKRMKHFKDSLMFEQRQAQHKKDSIQRILKLMEIGISEKQAVQIIYETDSGMKEIDKQIQYKLKVNE